MKSWGVTLRIVVSSLNGGMIGTQEMIERCLRRLEMPVDPAKPAMSHGWVALRVSLARTAETAPHKGDV